MALLGKNFRFRWLIVPNKLLNFFEIQLSLKRQGIVQIKPKLA